MTSPPQHWWEAPPLFASSLGRSFAPLFAVLLGGLGLAALVVRRRLVALVLGLDVALAASIVLPAWAKVAPRPPSGPTFRLMSANLSATNRDTERILAAIHRADPDVLLLQEYAKAQDAVLAPALAASMPVQFRFPAGSSTAGSAVYSKLPMVLEEAPRIAQERPQRDSTYLFTWQGRDLVLHHVHLYSPRKAWRIVDTFEKATALAAEPRPAIIAGDCNFTELSRAAAALRSAGWRESFQLAGQGPRTTFPADGLWRALFSVRIDQVYVSESVTAVRSTVGDPTGSDHLPVVVDVAWAAPP